MDIEQLRYHELCAYTLDHAHGDPSFIHQHVVDAFADSRQRVIDLLTQYDIG